MTVTGEYRSGLIRTTSHGHPQRSLVLVTKAVVTYAVLAAVLGVGVGALVRCSAGAVALLLVWPLLTEPVLGSLPEHRRLRSGRTCRS